MKVYYWYAIYTLFDIISDKYYKKFITGYKRIIFKVDTIQKKLF